MRQLFEIFYILHTQNRIVAAETIWGNTVSRDVVFSASVSGEAIGYGNMGCGVFKRGVKIKKIFA